MPPKTRTRPPGAKPRSREEAEQQEAVIELIQTGFRPVRVAHFRPVEIRPGKWITPVQGDGAGWLDLAIAGPGGQLFRELKSSTGKVEPEQQVWMDLLAAGGADVGVWRPGDLLSRRIGRELAAIRRPRRTAPPPAGVSLVDVDLEAFQLALEHIRETDPTSPAGRIATDALRRQHAAKEASRG
ncbi:hypothetical protein C1I95_33295 [Micromonospora craterilacus]|uniref:VRR-NUC domain-containing protein n=2 Tax=Micromonospora craterilacus TaxID=1655439 RepID=A0A2W2CXY6_9ACTN|nr:hypothetical protein C1I95_33295 [Micromonospora craterilacus]